MYQVDDELSQVLKSVSYLHWNLKSSNWTSSCIQESKQESNQNFICS